MERREVVAVVATAATAVVVVIVELIDGQDLGGVDMRILAIVDVGINKPHELAIIKNILIRSRYGIELRIPLGHSRRCCCSRCRKPFSGRRG